MQELSARVNQEDCRRSYEEADQKITVKVMVHKDQDRPQPPKRLKAQEDRGNRRAKGAGPSNFSRLPKDTDGIMVLQTEIVQAAGEPRQREPPSERAKELRQLVPAANDGMARPVRATQSQKPRGFKGTYAEAVQGRLRV